MVPFDISWSIYITSTAGAKFTCKLKFVTNGINYGDVKSMGES